MQIGEILNVGERNKAGHICVAKIESKKGMMYYVSREGYVFERKPLGRPKKVKVEATQQSGASA